MPIIVIKQLQKKVNIDVIQDHCILEYSGTFGNVTSYNLKYYRKTSFTVTLDILSRQEHLKRLLF